jgi:NADH-quinone oxidoreductase subunit C
MDDSAFIEILNRALPQAGVESASATSVDMPTIYVDRDQIVDVCAVLRDDPALQFAFLVEVTAADYLPAEPRWEVVYHLACLGSAFSLPGAAPAPPRRLRVKVRVPGADPRVLSIVSVYPAAGWLEREVFDLMGISFTHHPDLRRILMPEDWEGYPLRKDYPVQIRKDTRSWEPIQLSPEEFAANVQAARDRAKEQAKGNLEP